MVEKARRPNFLFGLLWDVCSITMGKRQWLLVRYGSKYSCALILPLDFCHGYACFKIFFFLLFYKVKIRYELQYESAERMTF